MNGTAFIVLVILAATGLLTHWSAAGLDDVRERHRVLGFVWVVLGAIAVLTIEFTVPVG
ncbi:MAG TPA: hypothetical protein VH969_23960 [Actinophytocola sp.]|jgi:hypothetical protein|uniref:hypothetical protein n=1 Tax=Actinophytocola sp. TaxID=1872138 RepID=UPI002F91FEB6